MEIMQPKKVFFVIVFFAMLFVTCQKDDEPETVVTPPIVTPPPVKLDSFNLLKPENGNFCIGPDERENVLFSWESSKNATQYQIEIYEKLHDGTERIAHQRKLDKNATYTNFNFGSSTGRITKHRWKVIAKNQNQSLESKPFEFGIAGNPIKYTYPKTPFFTFLTPFYLKDGKFKMWIRQSSYYPYNNYNTYNQYFRSELYIFHENELIKKVDGQNLLLEGEVGKEYRLLLKVVNRASEGFGHEISTKYERLFSHN